MSYPLLVMIYTANYTTGTVPEVLKGIGSPTLIPPSQAL